MGRRTMKELIRAMRQGYKKFLSQEGDEDMVSWKTLDPELLSEVSPSKLRRIKAAIKEQVREELRKEMQHDPQEVEEDRLALRRFAKDVEIDAMAHALVMSEAAEKYKKKLWRFSIFRVLSPVLIFLIASALFAAAVTLVSVNIPPPVMLLFIVATIGSIAGAGINASDAMDTLKDTFRNHADVANAYKELAEDAREVWRTHAVRAHTTDMTNDVFNQLRKRRDGIRNSYRMQFLSTELQPMKEKLRIQMSFEEDEEFETRLAAAQKKEEEEAEAEEAPSWKKTRNVWEVKGPSKEE